MRNSIIGVVVVLLAGCCTLGGQTEKAVRDAIAVNQGHVARAGMATQAVEVAQDNEDFLWDILYNGGCIDELPKAVRARKDARTPKKPGGDK